MRVQHLVRFLFINNIFPDGDFVVFKHGKNSLAEKVSLFN
jgi:hypothetical protein